MLCSQDECRSEEDFVETPDRVMLLDVMALSQVKREGKSKLTRIVTSSIPPLGLQDQSNCKMELLRLTGRVTVTLTA
jgi:hypothetical protein